MTSALLDRTHPDPPSAPPRERPRRGVVEVATGQWGVAALATIAALAAWWFSNHHDLAQLYADARSHLSIARRITDGAHSGFTQIGTVWLPLPHLVTAPFAAINSWWHSGFAAVPVNVACLVIDRYSHPGLVTSRSTANHPAATERDATWVTRNTHTASKPR